MDLFTTPQASAVTGISQKVLEAWKRSGFIGPSVLGTAGGHGQGHRYSYEDLIALRVARGLREAGISLQALRKVMARLRAEGLDQPFAKRWLVTDGVDVYLRDEQGVLSLLKAPGQRALLYVLDFKAAVEELRQNVEALAA